MIIKRTVPSEYDECVQFMNWCALNSRVHEHIFHIANERKANPWYGAKLKSCGTKKGIPDYFLCLPNEKYHGLFLEMKKSDQVKRKKKPEQVEWNIRLLRAGYYCDFVHGWIEASELIKKYINNQL